MSGFGQCTSRRSTKSTPRFFEALVDRAREIVGAQIFVRHLGGQRKISSRGTPSRAHAFADAALGAVFPGGVDVAIAELERGRDDLAAIAEGGGAEADAPASRRRARITWGWRALPGWDEVCGTTIERLALYGRHARGQSASGSISDALGRKLRLVGPLPPPAMGEVARDRGGGVGQDADERRRGIDEAAVDLLRANTQTGPSERMTWAVSGAVCAMPTCNTNSGRTMSADCRGERRQLARDRRCRPSALARLHASGQHDQQQVAHRGDRFRADAVIMQALGVEQADRDR